MEYLHIPQEDPRLVDGFLDRSELDTAQLRARRLVHADGKPRAPVVPLPRDVQRRYEVWLGVGTAVVLALIVVWATLTRAG
ncbi:hypothetical protein [Amycolatopsis sp. NPDC059657]|uniref:hypothetical protein n=1 Tax=Amycolatopsis sp. NPDC059657 TaxID=3346899 RepID=UPI00366C9EB5